MEFKGFEVLKEQIDSENLINQQFKDLTTEFTDEITYLYLHKLYDECKKLLNDARKIVLFLQKKVHNPVYRKHIDEFETTVRTFHLLVYRTVDFELISEGVGALEYYKGAKDFLTHLYNGGKFPNPDITNILGIEESKLYEIVNELMNLGIVDYTGDEEEGFEFFITKYGKDVYLSFLAAE